MTSKTRETLPRIFETAVAGRRMAKREGKVGACRDAAEKPQLIQRIKTNFLLPISFDLLSAASCNRISPFHRKARMKVNYPKRVSAQINSRNKNKAIYKMVCNE